MLDEYFDPEGYATEEMYFETQSDLFDAAEDFHAKIYLLRLESVDDIREAFRDFCAERNLKDLEQKLLAEALVEYYDLEAVSMFLD